MRRETIRGNCEAMEEKLEEDYKAFESMQSQYNKETVNIQDVVLSFLQSMQNPKLYYDVQYMYKMFRDVKSRLNEIARLESSLIGLVTSINSKVSLC